MRLPTYVLDRQDVVPLPGGTVYIDIPLGKVDRFRTHGSPQRVVVVVCKHGNNWELMESAQALSEANEPIGIVCTVECREKSDTYELVTLIGQFRCHFNEFFEVRGGVDAQVQPVLERLIEWEESLEADIKAVSDSILSRYKDFPPNLVERLSDDEDAVARMDAIAHEYLKTNSMRLKYLKSEDNFDRWDYVLDGFKARREQQEPQVPKVSMVVPKEEVRVTAKVGREDFAARLAKISLPPTHLVKVQTEIERYEQLPASATEKSVVADYIDWCLSIPWQYHSHREVNLRGLRGVLDASHHGLDDVKDHVVEHMVIERRRGGTSGTVLCFVGPPGTGKTSIAKSIAKATGRKLHRIALGGLNDEAEIRGHRRTYIGARPGRFVAGLKEAGTMDPLFLLDDVDKVARYKGDPMAALLELLDPEQNDSFTDRYMELPIDFSKAMFICTANVESDIHSALLDRMEFLQFRKYTLDERLHITRHHILPKLMTDYKVTADEVEVTDEVAVSLCKEEQLRQIEKRAGKLLRRAAVKIDVEGAKRVVIDNKFADQLLSSGGDPTRRVGFLR